MGLKVQHIVARPWPLRRCPCPYGGARRGGAIAPSSDFIGKWISLIAPAEAFICEDSAETPDAQRALEFASVRKAIENLRTFPTIRSLEEIGEIELHGAVRYLDRRVASARPAERTLLHSRRRRLTSSAIGVRAVQCFIESLNASISLFDRVFFTRTGNLFARKRRSRPSPRRRSA